MKTTAISRLKSSLSEYLLKVKAGEEVIVTDEEGLLLGVGFAVLSGREMPAFKRGVAVKLRTGSDQVVGVAAHASAKPVRTPLSPPRQA